MNNVIMSTKRSHNALVTSSQSLKKKLHEDKPYIRKLYLLYPNISSLPKPGLKPLKHVHLFTKWRQFLPHDVKDITCPLPPNSIIEKVRKNTTTNDTIANDDAIVLTNNNNNKETTTVNNNNNNNNANGTTQNASAKKKPQKRKQRKKVSLITRTITGKDTNKNICNDLIASDISELDSDYWDPPRTQAPRTQARTRDELPKTITEIQLDSITLGDTITEMDTVTDAQTLTVTELEVLTELTVTETEVLNELTVTEPEVLTETISVKRIIHEEHIRGKRMHNLFSIKPNVTSALRKNKEISSKNDKQEQRRVTRRTTQNNLPPCKRTRSNRNT